MLVYFVADGFVIHSPCTRLSDDSLGQGTTSLRRCDDSLIDRVDGEVALDLLCLFDICEVGPPYESELSA